MAKTDQTTLLEREIEQLRGTLAADIDALAYRANPKVAVRRQVDRLKAVFVEPGTGEIKVKSTAAAAGGVALALALTVGLRLLTRRR